MNKLSIKCKKKLTLSSFLLFEIFEFHNNRTIRVHKINLNVKKSSCLFGHLLVRFNHRMHIPESRLKELLIDAELGIPVQVGPSRELLCRARLHGAQVLDTPVAVEGEGERGRTCPTTCPRLLG